MIIGYIKRKRAEAIARQLRSDRIKGFDWAAGKLLRSEMSFVEVGNRYHELCALDGAQGFARGIWDAMQVLRGSALVDQPPRIYHT